MSRLLCWVWSYNRAALTASPTKGLLGPGSKDVSVSTVHELHETLLRPWQDGKDRIFADKAVSLFTDAARYGESVGEHALSVLVRWGQDSPVNALQQASAMAPVPVQVFTDGVERDRIIQNRCPLSNWGNFSTRFSPFATDIDTITSTDLSRTWAQDNATIYITYPLQSQNTVGPLGSGGDRRTDTPDPGAPTGKRVLFAIDGCPGSAYRTCPATSPRSLAQASR
jgi:hypothetical protein